MNLLNVTFYGEIKSENQIENPIYYITRNVNFVYTLLELRKETFAL